MREGRKSGPWRGGSLVRAPREPAGGWVWVGDHILGGRG